MSASANEQLARRYFKLLNDEEWDGFRDLWTDDAEVVAVGARPRHGIDGVMTYYKKIFGPWSKHVDEPVRVMSATEGDTVTVEVRFQGWTHDGRHVAFDAVDLFDLRDGRIRRLSSWYDIDYARRAIADG